VQGDRIAPGDMIRVSSGGRIFHAVVRGAVLGGFEVDPVERGIRQRRVKARDVVEHWARAAARRAAARTASSARSTTCSTADARAGGGVARPHGSRPLGPGEAPARAGTPPAPACPRPPTSSKFVRSLRGFGAGALPRRARAPQVG
jgi:hypothetical protein